MANHQSAIKRQRQNIRRRERNRAAKGAMKTIVRKATEALNNGQREEAQKLVREAEVALAKAGTKGIIHKSTASRKIGRLNTRLAQLAE